jgi:hypothetical protein
MDLPKIRLICRKERWGLTVQGWLFTIALLLALTIGIFSHLHPFLAITEPVAAEALVLEGWLTDAGVKSAIVEFNHRPYQMMITTGGVLPRGFYLSQYKTFAELAAATLKANGFNRPLVAVPGQYVDTQRTYANATALRDWITQSSLQSIKSINVYTMSAHARRSQFLYQKALGDRIKVGVIGVPNLEYDDQHWWRTSAGIKMVIPELLNYLYTRWFSVFE